jgi:hypothetical protein
MGDRIRRCINCRFSLQPGGRCRRVRVDKGVSTVRILPSVRIAVPAPPRPTREADAHRPNARIDLTATRLADRALGFDDVADSW